MNHIIKKVIDKQRKSFASGSYQSNNLIIRNNILILCKFRNLLNSKTKTEINCYSIFISQKITQIK